MPTSIVVRIIARGRDYLRKRRLCALLVLICIPFTIALSSPFNRTRGPVYSLDFFTSRATGQDGTLLELCGVILPANLHFEITESEYQARYEVSIVLFNQQLYPIASSSHKDTLRTTSLTDVAEIRPSYFNIGFALPPGQYRAVVIVEDAQSPNFSRFTKTIILPDYSHDLRLSDLRLSPLISRTGEHSPAAKNGWRIHPIPSRKFGRNARAVYVYSEVYNLSFGASEPERGVLSTYTIKDVDGTTLSSHEIPNIKVGSQSVLVAMIPIHDLRSGRYKLVLTLRDLETGLEVDEDAHFFVDKGRFVAERF